MPTYSYKARDVRGGLQTGVTDAPAEQDALRSLREEGLTVIDLTLGGEPQAANAALTRHAARNVKREEVIAFSSQLSVMLETGVPLSEALSAYLVQSRGGNLRRVVDVVADRINSGVSFSASIALFPAVFPSLMVSLLQASEATGTLGAMLGRVSEYLGKERRTRRQIRGALAYPLAMVSLAVTVTVFLIAWVLPRFAKIYESRSAALPTPTRVLLGASDWLVSHWLGLAVGIGLAVVLLAIFRESRKGRRVIDWLKLNTPLIGPIFRNFYTARAARTLGTLLASGVMLPEAVRITRGLTDNVWWSDLWDDMEQSMTSGGTIGDVALASPLLTPSYAQMIAAGERSGRLSTVLERIGAVAEEDLDEAVKTSTQMIEPLMIVFMGATIGGVALALLLPIFTMGSAMAH